MENENKYIYTTLLDNLNLDEFLNEYFFDDDNVRQYAIEIISINLITRDYDSMKKRLLQDLREKVLKDGFKNETIDKLNSIVEDYKKYREELSISRSPFYLEFRKRFP
jgi:hypothetical protein